MNRTVVATLAILLGTGPAFAQSVATSDFVKKAEIGGSFEVQAGHIAAMKGGTTAVKDFGQKMVHDHTMLDNKLDAAIAKDKTATGITLPQHTALDEDAQNQLDKLNSTQPANFDTVYINMMINDHKKDIAAFENYTKTGTDKIIRTAATGALPVIKGHLALAEKIQGQMGTHQASSR